MGKTEINLYVDDERPCPVGWTVARSFAAAIALMKDPNVSVAALSLDHDLGACAECIRTVQEAAAHLRCPHVPSGYDLARYLVENGLLPPTRPAVHSMNPTGRDAINGLLDRHYDAELRYCPPVLDRWVPAPERIAARELRRGVLVRDEKGCPAAVSYAVPEGGRIRVGLETDEGYHTEDAAPDDLYELLPTK